MNLYIDTTQNNLIELGVKRGGRFIVRKKFKSLRDQAEKLLPAAEKLLKAAGLKLENLKKIEVANRGGSFTSLRIGVVTANALAFALGIPVTGSQKSKACPERSRRVKSQKFSVAEPIYDRDPEITVKRQNR